MTADRARRALTSSWALGLLVAVATWGVVFRYPIPGLDPSWGAGLYMAAHDGLDWGTDVVFTYGPLGFLFDPVNWHTDLAAIAFVWNAVLWIALAIGFVWAFRRAAGPWVAVAGAFAGLALLTAIDVALALGGLLCFAALRRDPAPHATTVLAVAGAPFAAVEMLLKLSSGPPLLAMLVIALIGARARPWQLAAFAGLFAATFLGLWLGTGQPLANLDDYAGNSREIISGYSEAMSISIGGSFIRDVGGPLAALVTMLALIAAAAVTSEPDRRTRICATLTMAVAAFSLFKEGVVRYDVGHITIFFGTALILWVALPWRREWRLVTTAGATALLAAGVAAALQSDTLGARQMVDRLNPIDHVRSAGREWANLFQGGEREALSQRSQIGLALTYELPEPMRARIAEAPVAIDPSETGAAWAYGFNWHPLPVFQSYSAYTQELDRLNADAIASADGPEMILRRAFGGEFTGGETGSIDRRFVGWDAPAAVIAILCNFEAVATSDQWLLLGRVPDRCGEPREAGSVEASYGDTVDVPAPGPSEVVFVRIRGAEVSGLESVRSLLYKPKERWAIVNDERDYRFIPGTAEDGLLLRGSPRIVGAGPFARAPQAETLELTGPGGELRYDFYVMSVDTREGPAARQGG